MHDVTRAFDPEATHNLCVAFDNVCSTIAENDRSEFVKELIARCGASRRCPRLDRDD